MGEVSTEYLNRDSLEGSLHPELRLKRLQRDYLHSGKRRNIVRSLLRSYHYRLVCDCHLHAVLDAHTITGMEREGMHYHYLGR